MTQLNLLDTNLTTLAMNLVVWHERLAKHFEELHLARSVLGNPVFVLEHGFCPEEIDRFEADIQAYIQKYSPTDKHWLPWIVYAAELGYKYVGHEYWQTFEASTVGWRSRGRERDWVRDKFRKFERDYGGAVPSGDWAEHFNIICHPITHAILPKDFQSQLAEVLYTIRHLFTIENLQSPEKLGELIASHSLQQSKRFQQFVQDIRIVGLIAKALLKHEEEHTSGILFPVTLQRIVTDLGREGVALDQLCDARRSAQATQRRGLSGGRTSRPASYSSRAPVQDAATIEPRLILRRTTPASWETLLETPDLSPLLDKRSAWRTFLERTRATVTGSRAILARGKLLFGTNTVQLRTFPEAGKPLLTFESDETPDELMRFMEKKFKLEVGATILCRIASDGRAYQSRGLLVRPGRNYLVLSTTGTVKSSRFTLPINVTCDGLNAVQLFVPENITPDCRILIESLHLKIAQQVSVFPVGVAAAKWDDEGYGEWLTTDEPCVGVHTDHWVDALLLELNDEEGSRLEVCPEEAGRTVFVQLPPLSRGEYQLMVSARASAHDQYEEISQLHITIREPRSWKSAVHDQGALIAMIEPRKPTLEQLARGAVGIEMYGPAEHQVQVTATFYGKHSAMPLEPPHKLASLRLPINFNSGRAYLAQLSRKQELQSAFDFAYSCRLDFAAGELGVFPLICEREFTPLRWIVGRSDGSYLLSFSDDSGASEQASITRYDFGSPDRPNPISYKQTFENHVVPQSGGLYVARGSMAQCSIIFPHEIAGSVRTFADMGCAVVESRFQPCQPNVESLQDALVLFKLWAESRTTGAMIALLAQQRVLQAYIAHIFRIICGSQWATAEGGFRTNPYHPSAALRLIKAVADAGSISGNLLQQCEMMKDAAPKEHAAQLAEVLKSFITSIRVPRVGLASQCGVVVSKGGRWQAEFALRLASAPETVEYWARDCFIAGLKGLLDNPLLARAARFLVLATSHHPQGRNRTEHASLYAGWDWT